MLIQPLDSKKLNLGFRFGLNINLKIIKHDGKYKEMSYRRSS